MRQGGPEGGPRLLECRGVKCTVACQRQATDQFLSVNERSCLEKMINDLPGVLFKGIRIEPLDRICDARVQALSAWGRDVGKQRLTDKFMGEGKWSLRPLGAGDDYPHLLRLLDGGKEFVNVDLADRS